MDAGAVIWLRVGTDLIVEPLPSIDEAIEFAYYSAADPNIRVEAVEGPRGIVDSIDLELPHLVDRPSSTHRVMVRGPGSLGESVVSEHPDSRSAEDGLAALPSWLRTRARIVPVS